MASLLERLLREEPSLLVLALIDEKVREAQIGNVLQNIEINFNVFDAVIDLKLRQATLYDVLDPTLEQTLPLADLISFLQTQQS